jgi:hypothetical protein
VPRYLIERTFTVSIEDLPPVARESKRRGRDYPGLLWEHSHVVVQDDGRVRTYCVYTSPDEATLREHAIAFGHHTVDVVHEIAGDASPDDYPDV